jgi:hypothetical protein
MFMYGASFFQELLVMNYTACAFCLSAFYLYVACMYMFDFLDFFVTVYFDGAPPVLAYY